MGPGQEELSVPSWVSSFSTVTEKISLEVPENILESSQRAHVTVMGKGHAGDTGPAAAGRLQSSTRR